MLGNPTRYRLTVTGSRQELRIALPSMSRSLPRMHMSDLRSSRTQGSCRVPRSPDPHLHVIVDGVMAMSANVHQLQSAPDFWLRRVHAITSRTCTLMHRRISRMLVPV